MHGNVGGRIGRIGRSFVALGMLSLTVSACGTPPPAEPNRLTGTLNVQVPATLNDALAAVAVQFQTEHPGVKVQLAPPSADTASTADVTISEGPLGSDDFAVSQLVIAVATGNPKAVTRVADLPPTKVALCAAEQPCGAITERLLAGLSLPNAIRVDDTRAALAKVIAGDVDAALVYRSDAHSADDEVGTVELVPSEQVGFTATAAPNATLPDAAAAFVAFLTSTTAQERLSAHGLQPPV